MNGQIVGYARVSSTGQKLEAQVELLKKAGATKIYEEKKSGTTVESRIKLKEALDYVREGDIFIVTRLDRCSRSTADLYNITKQLKDKGVEFKAIQQDFDTSSSTGKLMMGILAVIAEFETDLRKERQAEGIKSALKRGVKFGAKAKMTEEQVAEAIKMQQTGDFTNQQIAEKFEVGRSTLLRYVAKFKQKVKEDKN